MMHTINGMGVVIVEGPSLIEKPLVRRLLSWPWRPWERYYEVSAHCLYDTLKRGSCITYDNTIYMTRETYNTIGENVGVY